MYSPREIFHREPAALKTAFTVVAAALVITGLIELSGEAVAAWAVAIEVVLSLFYVRHKVSPTSEE